MSEILDTPNTLFLNGNWLPIRIGTPRSAVLAMNAEGAGAAYALDIAYGIDEDGKYDFSVATSIIPMSWSEWVLLPVRPFDSVINTPNMAVRCPTVCVSKNYKKVPIKRFKLSKRTIYDRENGRCAYTGVSLSLSQSTLDHVISKDEWRRRKLEGSPDNFRNVVLCSPETNFKKANKTVQEAGLKLRIVPKEPDPISAVSLINSARHFDWQHFLFQKKKGS